MGQVVCDDRFHLFFCLRQLFARQRSNTAVHDDFAWDDVRFSEGGTSILSGIVVHGGTALNGARIES